MSSSESDSGENPKKDFKKKSSRHRSQKFRDEWTKMPQFQAWLRPVKENKFKANCALCNVQIVAELSALKRHCDSVKHKSIEKSKSSNTSIFKFTTPKSPIQQNSAAQAEIKLCGFLAEHNIPFKTMDHLTPLLQNIFPDSTIAKNLALKRTKSTAVVTNVIGATQKENLAQILRTSKFSVLIDESTDISSTKHMCIVVRLYNTDSHKIQTLFWQLVPIYVGTDKSDGTAEHLFNLTINTFKDFNIPSEQIIGFASDGCNLMMGITNSVSSRFRLECPGIVIMKCICHSLHICASRACKSLPRTCEDLARNIYNFFKFSSKRMHDFKQFQIFADAEVHKMLHPSQTRWLSLTSVVSRVLEQWNALKLFFNEKFLEERLISAEQIHKGLNDPFTKLFFSFLNFILPKISKMNLFFQTETVVITTLHSVMLESYKELLLSYMQRSYILQSDITKVDPEDRNYFLDKTSLYLGIEVYTSIQTSQIQSRPDLLEHFYERCFDFYSVLCKEISKRYDFTDEVLSNLHIFQPNNALKHSIRNSYPTLYPILSKLNRCYDIGTEQSIDNEWRLLPNYSFSPPDLLNEFQEVDSFWHYLKQFKNDCDTPVFENLSSFVLNILALPHSNASCERVFSKINNIKSKSRNRLITKTINGSLLAAESVAQQTNCTKFIPSEKMLTKMQASILYPKNEDMSEDDLDFSIE